MVHEERVERDGTCLLSRPNEHDIGDKERLTQSHLEQVNAKVESGRFNRDEMTGLPHMDARYAHWRPQGAWHPSRRDQPLPFR